MNRLFVYIYCHNRIFKLVEIAQFQCCFFFIKAMVDHTFKFEIRLIYMVKKVVASLQVWESNER